MSDSTLRSRGVRTMYIRHVDLDRKLFSSVELNEQRSVLKTVRSDGKMASLLYIPRSQGGAENFCTPLS